MSYLERSRQSVQKVALALSELPEFNSTQDRFRLNHQVVPTEVAYNFGIIFVEYLKIVRDLSYLSNTDLVSIHQANELSFQRGIGSNSASHGGADYFARVLGPEKLKQVFNVVQQAGFPNSTDFNNGLSDLTNRMTLGHTLSLQGETLSDGASAQADFAIHGHTKGIQPEAMVHFVMCHFLERVFTAHFSQDSDPEIRKLVSQKDTLLAAMGDVIRLRKAQHQVNPLLVQMWELPRSEGGLQWNKASRQEVYDEVIKKTAP